jgi:hypothetical protein
MLPVRTGPRNGCTARRYVALISLTVYLDQAKWIDLARAAHGRPGGEKFADMLASVRRASAAQTVNFPLSSGHYIETWRQTDDRRRRRLAETMIELSRCVTMASPPVLCNAEIDLYLQDRYGKPTVRRECPVFGLGLAHTTEFAPMHTAPLDPMRELELLARRPTGFLPHGRGHREFADAYAEAAQGLADFLGRETHPLQLLAMTAVAEIHENIFGALARADLPQELFTTFLMDEPSEFISSLPTRAAALRLREARHRNRDRKWESNDMNDVAYLACAVVHCDVIVTENLWGDMLCQSGLAAEHATTILTDLRDLAPELRPVA